MRYMCAAILAATLNACGSSGGVADSSASDTSARTGGQEAQQSDPSDTEFEKRYSTAFRQCMESGDAAHGVTVAIMDCLGSEIDVQDTKLNITYRDVMSSLSTAGKGELRGLQRAWITRRDDICSEESSVEEGGSLAAIIYNGCILRETVRRTAWLEDYPSPH